MRQTMKAQIRRKADRSGLGLTRYIRELILAETHRRPATLRTIDCADLQGWLKDIEAEGPMLATLVPLAQGSGSERQARPRALRA